MTLAVLVPVLLVALGVAAVVALILTGLRKWWQMLDAERELTLAPVQLLKEQNDLIAEMIGSTNIWMGDDLKDRLIAAHDKYRELERKYK